MVSKRNFIVVTDITERNLVIVRNFKVVTERIFNMVSERNFGVVTNVTVRNFEVFKERNSEVVTKKKFYLVIDFVILKI